MGSISTEKDHVLYLIRHGESHTNLVKKLIPANENILTDTGKEQASLLGEYLAQENFTSVFSSDHIRAYHTAQIILSKSKNKSVKDLEIVKDERLRDRALGIFENGPISDALKYVAPKIYEEKMSPVDIIVPGGDSPEKMFKNVETFFSDVLNKIDGSEDDEMPQNILAVTHAFAILYLAYYLIRSPEKFQLVNMSDKLLNLSPNTGFIKMTIEKSTKYNDPRRIEFLKIHETEHLKPLQKEDVLHLYTKTDSTAKKFQGCIHQ